MKFCDCGIEKKYFSHKCSYSQEAEPRYGCPYCDDHCPLCILIKTSPPRTDFNGVIWAQPEDLNAPTISFK